MNIINQILKKNNLQNQEEIEQHQIKGSQMKFNIYRIIKLSRNHSYLVKKFKLYKEYTNSLTIIIVTLYSIKIDIQKLPSRFIVSVRNLYNCVILDANNIFGYN